MGVFSWLFASKDPKEIRYIDLTSADYKRLERDAARGKSLGLQADSIVQELVQIQRNDGFLFERNGEWTKHPRAIEIGREVNSLGGGGQQGLRLMQAVALKVIFICGEDERPGYSPGTGTNARIGIGSCWNYIGDWVN